ncbi:hypothetical protein GCK72_012664 [Caenorhabditis remanei]|uniref:Galectin n=1 Tax=Caenorhabditis remanei TaxID=31234 RepID=A0A6A5GNI8_CAERE|nr:hypothetical protein GCK72_012664 [Caenorhabditis remanei]KAF1756211.1 hypothetical protein GCK72_012664 [Caenorhabditis remanei]
MIVRRSTFAAWSVPATKVPTDRATSPSIHHNCHEESEHELYRISGALHDTTITTWSSFTCSRKTKWEKEYGMESGGKSIVFNSFFRRTWDTEERRIYPALPNNFISIRIQVLQAGFQCSINNSWFKFFEHRLSLSSIEAITIRGSHLVRVHLDTEDYTEGEEMAEDEEYTEGEEMTADEDFTEE